MDFTENLIDSHAHLVSMEEKGICVEDILGECVERKFSAILDVSVDNSNVEKRFNWARGCSIIRTALGLYPGIAGRDPDSELARLEKLIRQYSPAAIGEIGLDFHWNYATPDIQRHLFVSQIKLANRFGLPVIIHTRNADGLTAGALKAVPPEKGGILHCFSSDWEFARACLDLGLLISFAGNLTYKKSEYLRDAAKKVPAESLLAETDAPYLAPDGFRGKTNTPLFIPAVYEVLADIRGVSLGSLIEDVNGNFFTLMGKHHKT